MTDANSEPAITRPHHVLQELGDRQLYRLAAEYCRRQLARQQISPIERGELMESLLVNAAKRAIQSPAERRAEQWVEIDDAYIELKQISESDTQDKVSAAQLALAYQSVRIFHARSLLLSALNAQSPARLRDEAQLLFRQAMRELTSLESTLSEQYRTATSGEDKRALRKFRIQGRFQLAECNLHSAELYPDRSPDQVRALTEAADQFALLGRARPASALTRLSRLREIEALRRLGSFDQAINRLKTFDLVNATPSYRLLTQCEVAAIAIDSNSALTAVERLTKFTKNSAGADANAIATARYTLVRGYAQLAQRSDNNGQDRKTWQTLAVDQLKQLEREHDVSWVRRAEALLTLPTDGQEVSDLELIQRTAANLYRRKEFDQAVSTYEKAARLASELGLADQAFELEFNAAAILQTNEQHRRAYAAFERLAFREPNYPRASEAHWLAIKGAAQIARETPTEISLYTEALAAHLDKWPQASTANQARIWLARIRKLNHQYEQAVRLLGETTSAYDPYQVVLTDLRSTYYAWVKSTPRTDTVGKEAAAHFARLYSDSPLVANAPKSPLACQAALCVVEFSYLFTDAAPNLFEMVIAANDLTDGCLKLDSDRTLALKGLGAAMGNDLQTAQAAWANVAWSSVPWTVPLVARIDSRLREQPSAQLATLQRHLIEAIQTKSGGTAWPELRSYSAQALIHAGRPQEAIAELQKIAADNPLDTATQIALAKVWESDGQSESLDRALACWRRVVRLSVKGSETWFLGKLGIARTLIQSGDKKRGVDSIKLMQALHPKLGGPYLKRQFEALLKKAEAP